MIASPLTTQQPSRDEGNLKSIRKYSLVLSSIGLLVSFKRPEGNSYSLFGQGFRPNLLLAELAVINAGVVQGV